jgi:aminoglycoside phosphotransferase (APT) family kinase protein
MSSGETAFVVRHPKAKACPDDLRAEYNLLDKLDGCRFPRTIEQFDIRGTPVALIEFIDGVHKDNFNELTTEEIEELARAVAEVHAHVSDSFSLQAGADPTQQGTHRDYLLAMIEETVIEQLKLLEQKNALGEYEPALALIDKGLKRLGAILDANPEDFSQTKFSLLHHDINPGNVLWGSDGKVTFIDPNPTYGDPCDDINFIVANNNGSSALQRALIDAYQKITGGNIVITDARMEAYTLKNWLDDLAWTIKMCEEHKEDDLYEDYCDAHARRYEALRQLLE